MFMRRSSLCFVASSCTLRFGVFCSFFEDTHTVVILASPTISKQANNMNNSAIVSNFSQNVSKLGDI